MSLKCRVLHSDDCTGRMECQMIKMIHNIFSSLALSYRWLINEFPNFIRKDDGRWFVSQVTGNLYVAKAELNDTANFFCFTTINMEISTKSTFSKANQLTVLPDGMKALQFLTFLVAALFRLLN